jgi:pimeloyl-[acyl-carrier protein] methyl ester esterase
MADAALAQAPARAVWFGWSLGGMVAAQAAAQAPARVAALCTFGSNLSFVASATWPHAMPAVQLAGFTGTLRQEPQQALSRFRALVAQGGGREALRVARASPLAARSPDELAAQLAVLADADLRAAVGAIACPQAWLFGGRDALVPAAAAAAVQEFLPAARVRVLEGAGHGLPLDDAATLAGHIEALVQELP